MHFMANDIISVGIIDFASIRYVDIYVVTQFSISPFENILDKDLKEVNTNLKMLFASGVYQGILHIQFCALHNIFLF